MSKKKTSCAICANAEIVGMISKNTVIPDNEEKNLFHVVSPSYLCGIMNIPLNNIKVEICSHFTHKEHENNETFSELLQKRQEASTEEAPDIF